MINHSNLLLGPWSFCYSIPPATDPWFSLVLLSWAEKGSHILGRWLDYTSVYHHLWLVTHSCQYSSEDPVGPQWFWHKRIPWNLTRYFIEWSWYSSLAKVSFSQSTGPTPPTGMQSFSQSTGPTPPWEMQSFWNAEGNGVQARQHAPSGIIHIHTRTHSKLTCTHSTHNQNNTVMNPQNTYNTLSHTHTHSHRFLIQRPIIQIGRASCRERV